MRDCLLLTPDEMAAADRMAGNAGPFGLRRLMENAGAAIAHEVLRHYPRAEAFDILCGPGNNGGDGYVAARILAETGLPVTVWALNDPQDGSDAASAAKGWTGETQPLARFQPRPGALVIDALFGAGLARPLDGEAARAAQVCSEAQIPVLAVDLPSGISGADGTVHGSAFTAATTVTFMARKPGHLLSPGRGRCGELIVADIGISDAIITACAGATFANRSSLWCDALPAVSDDTHKYARGHAAVCSGGPSATGAARLAALAAARAGAGAVTVLSPAGALQVNAMHLTSIMLARVEAAEELVNYAAERKVRSLVIGPGFGVGEKAREFVQAFLAKADDSRALIVDADAITSFANEPDTLFAACRASKAQTVLTPHAGEFARLFPDLAEMRSKLERARQAARRSHCTAVLKGPDTVIAAPDGRAAINTNGTPLLATAGSGDVLAGIIAGLTAQDMPVFEASCAAVWIHAEAARAFGPGLIAEDLPGAIPDVLKRLERGG
ncbi:NAD(P)H-hydrate dehydratase [Mesorhizobium sp. Z1-4]|uniref:NAD(P)H-hydrate dehydratase n=1 Tax=Mesorhizobium sp. Z1-4 TaxID=2448478 RepID=UPI000FD9A5D6|nr:NAD(P)H-hydrate dehydratase [Mesorhizobium sp. Z1-4]